MARYLCFVLGIVIALGGHTASGQEKKTRVTAPAINAKAGELIVLGATSAKGEVAFFWDARDFDARHSFQTGKTLLLVTNGRKNEPSPWTYSVNTISWEDRTVEQTLITVEGGPIPPGPAPTPTPTPTPTPIVGTAKFLIGVTDNSGAGRTLQQGIILSDESLRLWLDAGKIAWRVVDVQSEAFKAYKLGDILAKQQVTPPALIAWGEDGTVRATSAPGDAEGVKKFAAGKSALGYSQEWKMHYFDSGKELRWLTRLKPVEATSKALLASDIYSLSAKNLAIPRSAWRDVSHRNAFSNPDWIMDQNGYGACVGFGSVQAMRATRLLAGMRDRKLSPTCIYGQINGNRDQGAIIGDSAIALQKVGTTLYNTIGPETIYQRNFPDGWQTEAKRFRLEAAYTTPTFDEVVSAVQLGYVVVFGMQVGNNFESFDAHGVAGFSSGWGNHCLMIDGCKKLSDGRWVVDVVNSWGASWGPWRNGRCYMTEQHINGADNSDAYAIKMVMEDTQETIKPPMSSWMRFPSMPLPAPSLDVVHRSTRRVSSDPQFSSKL